MLFSASTFLFATAHVLSREEVNSDLNSHLKMYSSFLTEQLSQMLLIGVPFVILVSCPTFNLLYFPIRDCGLMFSNAHCQVVYRVFNCTLGLHTEEGVLGIYPLLKKPLIQQVGSSILIWSRIRLHDGWRFSIPGDKSCMT